MLFCPNALGRFIFSQGNLQVRNASVAEMENAFMDIEKVLDKLKEWLNRLADALFGPQTQPESEPIPVPVDDRRIR
jgi:hypothetical protein